jgi:DNA-binding response OmpR family regulator
MCPHILLVEDDRTTRSLLALRLQYAGYRITQASDGKTAFDLLERGVFDVVLTDIVMGDIDGIEVLYTARQQPYHPEVVILTGHRTLDTSIAAIRAGAYDYLMKPCSDDEMIRCIEGAFRRHQSEQQVRKATSSLISALSHFTASQGEYPESLPVPPGEKMGGQASHHPICVGNLVIGPTRHDVFFEGAPVSVTPTEFALLRCLAENPGVAHDYCDIVRYTHQFEASESEAQALVKRHIHNLRKKIDPSFIVNNRGTGYMLVNPDA